MQHYVTCHSEDGPGLEKSMIERFSLRLEISATDRKTPVRTWQCSKPWGAKPIVRVMVQQIGEGVFACPLCDETFPTRLAANKHTRKMVSWTM